VIQEFDDLPLGGFVHTDPLAAGSA